MAPDDIHFYNTIEIFLYPDDPISRLTFCVDTESERCTIPRSPEEDLTPIPYTTISRPNKFRIVEYGYRLLGV